MGKTQMIFTTWRRSVHVADTWNFYNKRALRIYVRGHLHDEFANADPAYVIRVASDIAKSEMLPLTLPKTLERFRP